MQARGERPSAEDLERIRAAGRAALIRKWTEDLEAPVAGLVTVEAVRSHLIRWVDRRYGSLSYRLVQVLTGHGYFGEYLHRVAGRETTPVCHECGAPVDTVRHTVTECAAWGPQRHSPTAVVGGDLSLSTIVGAMLDSQRCWDATASFCESVLSHKEASERLREDDPLADPLRRRRLGRRRRQSHLLPPLQ
ncbi:uncharacterized protein LOC113232917 [Hyposmocoma kahamanoa]|uniref:uncharacterized protein LOC113232917 n=1 Tax=Hyposmocoma kahamanoa TaxID=1477025 RepID=UPI000E6D8D81|nr:uncharacterized protein LOC113232917 [Hyposmocoma kahamanoa]